MFNVKCSIVISTSSHYYYLLLTVYTVAGPVMLMYVQAWDGETCDFNWLV